MLETWERSMTGIPTLIVQPVAVGLAAKCTTL